MSSYRKHRRASLVLVTLAALGVAEAARAQQWLAGDHLEKARGLLLDRDYAAAITELERVAAERPADLAARYALVQASIEGRRLDRALELARAGVEIDAADGLAWAALGDAQRLVGDFDGARESYVQGVQHGTPRARVGLGMLLESERERPAARVQFEKAFAEDPEDPEVLFAMARATPDLERTLELVRKALPADFTVEPEDRATIEGYAESRERLAGGGTCDPVGKAVAGEIKLRTIHPSAGEKSGLGMKISINGQKPFVSLIDTGATGLIVTERLADAAGVKRLSDVSFKGIGRKGAQAGYLAWAERLTLGDLEFEDCLVTVSRSDYLRTVLNGHESLVGLEQLYSDFEVTVDFPRALLTLEPLPPVPRAENGLRDPYAWPRDTAKLARGYLPMRVFGNDLMVPTLVNREIRAYFLLDSGASTNFLSERFAGRIRTLRPSGVGVVGLSGEVRDVRAVTNVELLIGGIRQPHDSVLALELDGLAVASGFGIDGFIGWDLLLHSVVSIDARNALIRIVPARR